MKTLKPRSSASVSRSLSSFKQNDRLFVLNQHVMFKDSNIIRYGTIKYIGLFLLPFFTIRLSGQSQSKSIRRPPPRSAHRLQIRRRVPCICSVVLDYQGPEALRLFAWLRPANRRFLHLPDRRFAFLGFLTRRFASERQLAKEWQFAEDPHAASSAIRSSDSLRSADALG